MKETYRRFAERECHGYSPLYEGLARAVSDDEHLASFLAPLPVVQPNLFFAAIQWLTGPEAMPRDAAGLRAFATRRGDEIAALMRSRRTQTNEVGRCAVLLPALPPGPLALIEVGASAGLCLLMDRFAYEFAWARTGDPERRASTHVGDPSSCVRLRCTVTGAVPLPRELPSLAWRRGLDTNPIDVRDDDAVRWLLACVWADHPERRERLEAAIEVARTTPPPVHRGDLVDDLPSLLADVPADARLVVFHSAVLTYVSAERRRTFADILAETSKRREVLWLSDEAPGVIPEITARAPAVRELRFLVGRTRFVEGRRHDELLALAHPHGAELVWR